ncbi:MAG: urease accessory protein UreF [Panacagrimonas sp.]
MSDARALAALLQLASPTQPVGAYSYSQGRESANDAGIVCDESSAALWIEDGLTLVLTRYEAPLWLRLHAASAQQDHAALAHWNEDFLATRETAELRAETVQMGYSLVQLMRTLGHAPPLDVEEIAYPTAHAWACTLWGVDAGDGLLAYLYAWAENQVMAALKAVPLGQSAGQRLLLGLRDPIADAAQRAATLADEALSTQSPMLAILSGAHETQYSRLFRS